MMRVKDHRNDLEKCEESTPAYHFHRPGHTTEDMKAVVLEGLGGKDEAHRLERERWWIERLGTLQEENKL